MTYLCITVDLDRDANIFIPGQTAAGSADHGSGKEPRFDSTRKGLSAYLDLLDDLNVPATFFAEGRTLEMTGFGAGRRHELASHGLEHEDFSLLAEEDAIGRLERSKWIIKDVSGTDPISFRAPYMRTTPDLQRLLVSEGFLVDSSLYGEPADCVPHRLSSGIIEMPVAAMSRPGGGRTTSYLWPMHEGNRSPESYVRLAEGVPENGTFVLADHCWHLFETKAGTPRDGGSVSVCIRNVRETISSLLDAGLRAVTMSFFATCH